MGDMKNLCAMTVEIFERMPKEEGINYELIDGTVMMSPRPAIKHQKISGRLFAALWNILKGKNCEPIQEIDLVLEDNHFVPDLMVICNDTLDGTRYEMPPLIVLEIVSPTSSSRDYITKRHKYEQLGIKEYWIVSPEEKCITVFDFASGTNMMYCEEQVKSSVLPDIIILLSDIFPE